MTEPVTALSSWETFYVIVGSSGGALIGERHRSAAGAIGAFGTPTVVHCSGALLLSAIMSVPWQSLFPLSVALGLCGLGGLAYGAIVVRRARRQTDYKPVWQDWLWFTALPCLCYVALTVAAAVLHASPELALSGAGIATLGLLLIGIHNAWDSVTHLVITSAGVGKKRSH